MDAGSGTGVPVTYRVFPHSGPTPLLANRTWKPTPSTLPTSVLKVNDLDWFAVRPVFGLVFQPAIPPAPELLFLTVQTPVSF